MDIIWTYIRNYKKNLSLGIIILFIANSFISCKKDNKSNNPIAQPPVFNSSLTYGTMTDQDGITYKTIQIGKQVWMAENLRTTKYNDGKDIPHVITKEELFKLDSGAYCIYNNTFQVDYGAVYGRLYNWFAVNTGKLAPVGWHIPTMSEWDTLITLLVGEVIAGGKMKEVGILHWTNPNIGATNESGFTALPSGQGNDTSISFGSDSATGDWWSSSGFGDTFSFVCYMYFSDGMATIGTNYKKLGISVRCVKD